MSSMVIISSVCYLILCASVALLPTVGRAQRGGGTVWAKKGVAPSVLGAPLRLAPCIWPRQSRLYALCVCSDCPERKSRIYIVCFLKHMFSEAAPLAWLGWITWHTFLSLPGWLEYHIAVHIRFWSFEDWLLPSVFMFVQSKAAHIKFREQHIHDVCCRYALMYASGNKGR